jgi:CubicO group peptidase (beta-lactamase class C family)
MKVSLRYIFYCFLHISILTFWGFDKLKGQSHTQLLTEIEKIIRFDTEIDYRKTPGFMIGVIDMENEYKFQFGRRDIDNNKPCNFEDFYEVGSCTKIYTASIVQRLVQLGILDDKMPINSYLDSNYQNPRLTHLTIHHLINHMSGFPKKPARFGAWDREASQPYIAYSKRDLMTYYRDFIPEKKRSKYIYSHTNYAILEHIIENATGMALEDAFQYYLASSLDLYQTHFDVGENKSELIAPGYDRAMKRTDPWVFNSFKASEGIKISLMDALKMLKYQMGQYNSLDQKMLNPGIHSELKIIDGWHLKKINKKNYVFVHTGQTSGHSAFMGMVPMTNTAVVILSNSKYGTEDLGMQILRMINYNWQRKPNI